MFKTLYIQNFQTHTKTKIDFSAGVTTIVGPSDIGKSAILRALRWLCLNNPQGSAFITEGEDGAAVKLVVDDTTITRRRTNNENLYRINDQVYKAFGSGVPDAVQQTLSVTELNFQEQHDSPFWLSLSASEVSRQLNEIVDLSIIDKALSNASKATRHAKKELQICEQRLKKAKQDRDDLEWIFECQQQWQGVQRIAAVKAEELASTARLQKISVSIHGWLTTRQNANAKASQGRKLLAKAEKLKAANDKVQHLAQLLQKIQKNQVRKVPSSVKLHRAAATCQQLIQENDKLKQLAGSIEQWTERLHFRKAELEVLQEDMKDLTENQTCPVCGKEM